MSMLQHGSDHCGHCFRLLQSMLHTNLPPRCCLEQYRYASWYLEVFHQILFYKLGYQVLSDDFVDVLGLKGHCFVFIVNYDYIGKVLSRLQVVLIVVLLSNRSDIGKVLITGISVFDDHDWNIDLSSEIWQINVVLYCCNWHTRLLIKVVSWPIFRPFASKKILLTLASFPLFSVSILDFLLFIEVNW